MQVVVITDASRILRVTLPVRVCVENAGVGVWQSAAVAIGSWPEESGLTMQWNNHKVMEHMMMSS
jgi:hypothetical protein